MLTDQKPSPTTGRDDWDRPRWISYRWITGYLACLAIRQVRGVPFPAKLEGIIGFLTARIRPRFDENGLARMTIREVRNLLHEELMPEQMFLAWNDENVVKGWIDLDALIHNVCVAIGQELDSTMENLK